MLETVALLIRFFPLAVLLMLSSDLRVGFDLAPLRPYFRSLCSG